MNNMDIGRSNLIEIYQDIKEKYVKIKYNKSLWIITPEDIRLNGKILTSLNEFAPEIYDDLIDKICNSVDKYLRVLIKEIRR